MVTSLQPLVFPKNELNPNGATKMLVSFFLYKCALSFSGHQTLTHLFPMHPFSAP